MAAGVAESDVDDGYALLYVLNSPELDLRGVSIVFGNHNDMDAQVAITEHILAEFGPGRGPVAATTIQAYPGAQSPEDLLSDVPTPAVLGMKAAAEAAAEAGTKLVVLAVGTLTNVAHLYRLFPASAAGISEVVVVAGRRPGQRFTTGTVNELGHPDLNFELDTRAFRELLGSPLPLTYLPFEITSQVSLTEADLEAVKNAPGASAAGAWVHTVGLPWLGLWRRVFGVDGFHPFDCLAAIRVTHPGLVHCEGLLSWVQELPDDKTDPRVKGKGDATKLFLLAAPADVAARATGGKGAPPPRPVLFCFHAEGAGGGSGGLKDLLLARLAGGGGTAERRR